LKNDGALPELGVRDLRLKLRLTQEELAHAIGVTFSTINRWENGHAKPSKLARRAIELLRQTRGMTGASRQSSKLSTTQFI